MTDLSKYGQVLYVSSADISFGDGPGVNERDFILALHKALGDRAHFLIPQPLNPVPEVPESACTFTLPHRAHDMKLFVHHQAEAPHALRPQDSGPGNVEGVRRKNGPVRAGRLPNQHVYHQEHG